ncbi:fatty acid desaturase [Nocardia sp. NPDC057030]|uniref:fatty acid desaturase n=1 Tax=unclassified Nocardia TaxID=2637762 RepID=UPI0036424505
MDDVRASYLRFPHWTQHFWTWQTGRALPEQQPLFRHTWASYLAMTLAVFLTGLIVSTLAVALMFPLWFLVLPIGWLLTVNGERVMVLVIAHQALHRRFSGSKRWDTFWGEVVTVLSVFHTLQAFKEEHFDNHHRREVFATEADPPVQFLHDLGFRPGLSRAVLWRRAWVVFLSPVFYWNGFRGRIVSSVTGRPRRTLGLAAWLAWWLSLPFWLPHGTLVLVHAFVLPVIVFAQLSALLDRLGEHEWLAPRNPEFGHRFYTAANTSARFCGSAVPSRGSGPLAWARWTALSLGYHLPSRLLVVVGDLPNHDYHHRYPSTPEWTTAAYARQRDIDTGPEGPPYREVWGMGAAIDLMFRSLSGQEDVGNAPSHR